jgi:cell shape-determining protein MreC
MKNLPENLEDQERPLKEYKRLLHEFDRLKDENRQLKEQLELANFGIIPNSI